MAFEIHISRSVNVPATFGINLEESFLQRLRHAREHCERGVEHRFQHVDMSSQWHSGDRRQRIEAQRQRGAFADGIDAKLAFQFWGLQQQAILAFGGFENEEGNPLFVRFEEDALTGIRLSTSRCASYEDMAVERIGRYGYWSQVPFHLIEQGADFNGVGRGGWRRQRELAVIAYSKAWNLALRRCRKDRQFFAIDARR